MVMELENGDGADYTSTSATSAMVSLLPLASVSQQPYVSELLSFTLDHLHKITEIPNLTSGCTEFIESAEPILEERKMNQALLANHSTLLDLLEIPQLMDTCVRNGNYDEALDLEAFVCKLSTMHPKLPVIQALAAEVRQTTQSLLSQLLQRLCSNIQFPECLRIIGYLRQIGVFSEYEMILQRNAYEYLKRMISCHILHLFDVVNQYCAIFADDTSGSEENYDGGLLFSWAMHQITSHLKTLKVMLPKITEGGSLSNILDQCMYCAKGVGWVEQDFRGLLPSLFEEAVLSLFSKNMNTAVENFQLVLDSHRRNIHLLQCLLMLKLIKLYIIRGLSAKLYSIMIILIQFLESCVSAAMNELRPCAPVSLKNFLAQELIKGLLAVSDSLLMYNATRMLREMSLDFSSRFAELLKRCILMKLGRLYLQVLFIKRI
ncbi:hypothetical protein CRYUN_Cryun02cG0038600 [Craigia yunnanensis]